MGAYTFIPDVNNWEVWKCFNRECDMSLFISSNVQKIMLYIFIDETEVWKGCLIYIAQLVINLPAMQETPVQFLGLEDPLEKG